MQTQKSASASSQKFPRECCGVCKFSRPNKPDEDYTCFVDPPQYVEGQVTPFYVRGGPVDPTDPACREFVGRQHA